LVKYVRLYAGPDGESHFQDMEMAMEERDRVWGSISEIMAAKAFNLRQNTEAYDLDWHPAPQRQFIFNLEGSVRIEAGDGEIRTFGPGSILLVEDTHGRGHRSKQVSSGVRTSVWVQLPD
jgi:hypothetical protein